VLWTVGAITGSFVAASALTSLLGSGAMSGIAMLFVPLVLAGMIPSKIVVGVDGVLVKWLFTKRFIPMSQITAVTRADDRAIRFHLSSGESVVVHTSMRGKYKTARAPQHRDAVLARVAEALAAFRARGASVDVSALVGRGTRTKNEWLDALRKLRAGGGGYRSALVRDDDLWRVVEDPAAPADERAGAAMVLRRSLDESGRARVRVAAEASASPKLRVVLDAAASETDDALESAIDDLAKESA
jgi:hypothetical protein